MDLRNQRTVEIFNGESATSIIGVDHSLESLNEVANAISHVDCLLVELLGNTAEERRQVTENMNAITEGYFTDDTLYELLETSDDYLLHLAVKLRGSGILMIPIDTPEDPEDQIWKLVIEERKRQERFDFLHHKGINDPVAEAALIGAIAISAQVDTLREERMAEQIRTHEERLKKVFGNDTKISALVGLAHAEPIAQHLAA